MSVTRQLLPPSIRKPNGMLGLDLSQIKLPFDEVGPLLYVIPPLMMGGNHRHPRREAFIGLGEGLELVYHDEQGTLRRELMNPAGELWLFMIDPLTPHTVVNRSTRTAAHLLEWADGPQREVEPVVIVKSEEQANG